MKKIPLSKILTPLVKTTTADTAISLVMAEMATNKISCVVAVDAQNHPLGIFTERDAVRLIAERGDVASLKLDEVMSVPPFTSEADIDFREAYRMLQERGFRHLIVVDKNGCLEGIVTEGDFLQRLDFGDLSEFKVAEKVMSRNIVTVEMESPLADAISLMSRHRYSCIVVMNKDVPEGIITERDVVKLATRIMVLKDVPVSSVIRSHLITVSPDTTLPDAIALMAKNKIRHLVVTENKKLVGLLTRHDLVKTLQGSYVHFLHDTIQLQREELFKLNQSRSLFKLHDVALAAAANAILIADRQAVIQWANPAFSKLSGYTLEETVGMHIRDLVRSGKQGAEFYADLWRTILDGRVWQGEIVNRRKDGSSYHEEMTITPVRIDSEAITHFIAMKQDISERKLVEAQIYDMAFFDALTRLPNRRLLGDRLEQTMASCKRSGIYGALMFLDLDNFKPLNDAYGHDVGDLLLIEVATRIANCVRESDTVARFGGDEFVVILGKLDPGKDESAEQATAVAGKIRVKLAEPYLLTIEQAKGVSSIVEHHCTSSIGVVLFKDEDVHASEVIKWADLAMYQSKAMGRNLIQFYEVKQVTL